MANILLVVGTNRPGANALRIGKVIASLYAAAGEPIDTYSLHEMPPAIFDPRSYVTKPDGWVDVQRRVVESKGLHLITPEYNGGFPGVLKYFIDMLKFPESFEHKPVAFVGEAHGMWGALRPVEQLQQIFGYRNAHIFPERIFIPEVDDRFDVDGEFSDTEIKGRLEHQLKGFIAFCNALQTESRK